MEKPNNIGEAFPIRFLKWFCPHSLYEEIEGDLIQQHQRDIEKFGEWKAKRRLFWNVIRFFRPGILIRNKRQPGILDVYSNAINPFPTSMNFKKATDWTGWLIFSVALFTYFLTVEETASYWDCSEFIAPRLRPYK